MSDCDIKSWEKRLEDQVKRGWENYLRRRIHLDVERFDELWSASGEFVYIEEVSSESARASIKLNRNTNDPLDLVRGVEIKTVFKEIYITHAAQADEWIDLIIGINFSYYKPMAGVIEGARAREAVPLTHANPDTNVAPAAQICNRACIKADVNNTQTAWIDFGTAAIQDACMPLDPGESITVTTPNLDQINANFEVGGEYVFIVYEV